MRLNPIRFAAALVLAGAAVLASTATANASGTLTGTDSGVLTGTDSGVLTFASPAGVDGTWSTWGFYPTRPECIQTGQDLVDVGTVHDYNCSKVENLWMLRVLD